MVTDFVNHVCTTMYTACIFALAIYLNKILPESFKDILLYLVIVLYKKEFAIWLIISHQFQNALQGQPSKAFVGPVPS